MRPMRLVLGIEPLLSHLRGQFDEARHLGAELFGNIGPSAASTPLVTKRLVDFRSTDAMPPLEKPSSIP